MKNIRIFRGIGYIKYIPFLTLGLLFASCEDDVVNQVPVDRITEETAYNTIARCELAMVGAYDAAQSGDYNGTGAYRGYPFGAASVEQGEARGADMVQTIGFYGITYNSSYSTTSANNTNMWSNSFAAINRYNAVIEGIEGSVANGTISSEIGMQYLGEARFLRALTYHNLLIHFARPYAETPNASHYGLPIYNKAINTPQKVEEAKSIGRSSVADCYQFILTDLDFAEQNLYEKNKANGITRASIGAAIALKTRVYLHMGNWQKAIDEAVKLAPGTSNFASTIGGYRLEAKPETPFVSYSNNSESIFSVEHSSDDNASVNGSLSVMMYGGDGGRGAIALSPILYNASFWTVNDKRRSSLLLESDGLWFVNKYTNPNTMTDYAPIIRYAEVLLNYAEAEARINGNSTLALTLLNTVRDRSVAAGDVFTASSFASKNEIIRAILNERRIEFTGEGRRWEDIHRLALDTDFSYGGIPEKAEISVMLTLISDPNNPSTIIYDAASGVINPDIITHDAIPYADRRFIWPIPLDETNVNPILLNQQNEGW